MKNDKKKDVVKNDRKKFLFFYFFILSFLALAWYFLYVRNADTMFFMQD